MSPSELRLRPRSTHEGSRSPSPWPGALSGVTDQSTTVASWTRRTAWMANRVLILSPSAVVHSASAATGNFGLVGAGSAVCSTVGDCGSLIPEEPRFLLGVRAARRKHACRCDDSDQPLHRSHATILGSAALSARRIIVTP